MRRTGRISNGLQLSVSGALSCEAAASQSTAQPALSCKRMRAQIVFSPIPLPFLLLLLLLFNLHVLNSLRKAEWTGVFACVYLYLYLKYTSANSERAEQHLRGSRDNNYKYKVVCWYLLLPAADVWRLLIFWPAQCWCFCFRRCWLSIFALLFIFCFRTLHVGVGCCSCCCVRVVNLPLRVQRTRK